MAVLLPIPKFQAFTATGALAAGYKLYSYEAGTTTPLATYTDSSGATPNTNPVILDSRGEASVWYDGAELYKLVLKTAADVTVWTMDNVGASASTVHYLASGADTVARDVASKLGEIVSVQDYGASPSASASANYAAIIKAVKAALALRSSGGLQSVTVFFPTGRYDINAGLPIVTGIVYACLTKWGAVLRVTGTEPAFYSAQYIAGEFEDLLSAIEADVQGGDEAHSAGIVNLVIDHIGAIGGTSESGATYNSVIQLRGCPGFLLDNPFIASTTDNVNGVSMKYCWQSRLVSPYIPRQNGRSGGIGLVIDSTTNAVVVDRPVIYGEWDIGMEITGSYAVTVINPDIELGCTVGLRISSGSQIICDGGYFEGNQVDIQVGVSGSLVDGWELRRTRHNGSSSQIGIELIACTHGMVDRPFFDGTYSTTKFAMTGAALVNYNNEIITHSADASTVNLTALGLSGGRNFAVIYGDDDDDAAFRRIYSTRTLKPIDIFTRSDAIAFAASDTTPSVKNANLFTTANASATVITNLDDGATGQPVTIVFTDGNTTINDGGNFALASNFVSTANDVLNLVLIGAVWVETSRSVN